MDSQIDSRDGGFLGGGFLRLTDQQTESFNFLKVIFKKQLAQKLLTTDQILEVFISNNFDFETSHDEIQTLLSIQNSDDEDVNYDESNAMPGLAQIDGLNPSG